MYFQCQCLKLFSMSYIFLHGVLHKHRGNLRCDTYVPTKPSCKLYLITCTPVVPMSSEWVLLHISTPSESVISSVCDIAGISLLESCSGWLSHSWVLFVCCDFSCQLAKRTNYFLVDLLSQAGPAQMWVSQVGYRFSSPSDQCSLNWSHAVNRGEFSMIQEWNAKSCSRKSILESKKCQCAIAQVETVLIWFFENKGIVFWVFWMMSNWTFLGNTGKVLWWCLLGKTWTFSCVWILHRGSAIPHDMLADWEFFGFKNWLQNWIIYFMQVLASPKTDDCL